jgi:hypothetical protein
MRGAVFWQMVRGARSKFVVAWSNIAAIAEIAALEPTTTIACIELVVTWIVD